MSKTSCPVGVWTSIACSALWQETTYLSVSIRFSEWKLVTAPSRQIDMRLKTIKRWGEWKHLRDSTSTIPHVCPVFFNPYSLIIHFQTQPNPSPHIYMHTMCSNLLCLIYPSTFPHSFPYILNQALLCPPASLFGCGASLAVLKPSPRQVVWLPVVDGVCYYQSTCYALSLSERRSIIPLLSMAEQNKGKKTDSTNT